jgi:tape measure domain-containing protein
VTGSQTAAQAAFENIKNIAEATRSPLNEVGDLYSKLTIATQSAGVSAAEVAQMTTTFSQALLLSGASAGEAQAAILQFGQAMASGRLQGDEFRSLMESSPVFMRKLSEALDRPIGDLKALASEGVLTAEIIRLAMQEMAPEVQDEFDQMQTTLGQSFTLIQNNFMEMMANVEASTGIFQGIANVLKTLSENTKIFAVIAAAAFGAATARMIFGIVRAMVALRSAIAGATLAQATLLAFGGPAGLAALAAGAAAATAAYFALSEMMDRNNAEMAEQQSRTEAEIAAQEALARANQGAAAAELARAQAAKTADKETERANRRAEQQAQARENSAARNAQRIRDNIAQLQVETTQLGERLDLDLRLVGTAEDYAEKQNRLFEIEKARAEAIAEIRAKELSTNPAENARQQAEAIAQVNAEYDRQTQQLERLIAIRIREAEVSGGRDVSAIGREGQAAVDAINAEIAARTQLFEYQRNQITETQRILSEAAEAEAVLREQAQGMDQALFDQRLKNIQDRKNAELAALAEVTEAERRKTELSISFSEGIRQAQQDALLRIQDEATYAKDLFNTAMDGFSNSILKFVETGKLSFKDLFKSLMAEIIKMQANKLFLQLFGGDGILGSLLPGVFGKKAVGGPVMAGKPYVVGERGPELFVPSGPGTVIANGRFGGGGVTQVTYNIQAVDALSFKQLVARDPEFIYSVTQAGARRLPR